jgi:hypothetical protein
MKKCNCGGTPTSISENYSQEFHWCPNCGCLYMELKSTDSVFKLSPGHSEVGGIGYKMATITEASCMEAH